MLNVLCFWFGALLAGLDSLILAAFAQMKLGPLHAEIAAQVSMVARHQATGRIEPRAKRQQQSEIEVS